jgi:hypothetical protein
MICIRIVLLYYCPCNRECFFQANMQLKFLSGKFSCLCVNCITVCRIIVKDSSLLKCPIFQQADYILELKKSVATILRTAGEIRRGRCCIACMTLVLKTDSYFVEYLSSHYQPFFVFHSL